MVTDGSAPRTTFAMMELNLLVAVQKLSHAPRVQRREPGRAVRCGSSVAPRF